LVWVYGLVCGLAVFLAFVRGVFLAFVRGVFLDADVLKTDQRKTFKDIFNLSPFCLPKPSFSVLALQAHIKVICFVPKYVSPDFFPEYKPAPKLLQP
jgi:hypothetical protein